MIFLKNPTYIVSYNVAAAILILSFVFIYFIKNRFYSKRTTIFKALLIIDCIVVLLDIASAETIMNYDKVPVALNYIINIMYFYAFILVPVVYFFYIAALTQNLLFLKAKGVILVLMPVIIYWILVAITPATKWFFYFNRENQYCYGIFHDLVYAFAIVYILASVWVIIKGRKRIKKEHERAVLLFCIAIVIFAFIQGQFMPDVLFANFIASICLVFVGITIENPEYYIGGDAKLLNEVAFTTVINENIKANKEWVCYMLNIANDDLNLQLYGADKIREIRKDFGKYLRQNLKTKQLFRLSDTRFAFVFSKEKEDVASIKMVYDRLDTSWYIGNSKMDIEYCILKYSCPEDAKTIDEFNNLADYVFKKKFANNELLILNKETRETFERENNIQKAVDRAVKEKNFSIKVQPIFGVLKQRCVSFETLCYLSDDEMGNLNPGNFISIAEEAHFINQLGVQIFEKACQFVQENNLFERGIENMKVNVSPLQCNYTNMAEDMLSIIEKYNIPPTKVDFEIVESAILSDKEEVWRNIQLLKDAGVSFALDDYGTGYSNIISLLKTPVKYIKIDKGIIWSCTRGENKILHHLIPMLKEHGFVVIAEGVETEKQKDLLEKLGCEYLQGFFFSKPLSPEQFLEYLQKENL